MNESRLQGVIMGMSLVVFLLVGNWAMSTDENGGVLVFDPMGLLGIALGGLAWIACYLATKVLGSK